MDRSSNVTCPLASSAGNTSGLPVADINAATRLLTVFMFMVVLVRVSAMLTSVASPTVAVGTRGAAKEGFIAMPKQRKQGEVTLR
jgi:hypothetical protein